jgi:CheY-like chemotaxis protein/prolyl-tRNA editing enzyme YbaK/EbsC (Cys-tRNA(Pro) deacylase)
MAVPHWLKHLFEHYEVPFEEHAHTPAFSASHLAHAVHVPGHQVAKTVLLAADGRPVAVVLPADARLDLSRVVEVLGCREVRFASEAEIAAWFKGCPAGTVPPLRLRADLEILMDKGLGQFGKIVFAAGAPDNAVAVRFRDWYRMVRPGWGRFALPANGHEAPAPPLVLVVEDEADTNQLFCRLLQREGFACQGVESGNRALEVASSVRPSAILLDLMLPDMSGFEMYDRLRRIGPLKHTPVVVVTALNDEESRRRGRAIGADAYLTKPFTPETLLKEVHGALADAQA